jgi:DNA-binding NarL/FixJ family response regulator
MTHRSNAVVNNCLIQEPDILLVEVSYADGATIDSRIAAAQELRRVCPTCKIVFLCDENSSPEIAKEVMTAKKDGMIDAFFYSSVTAKYLVAALDAI